jgi:peptidoglycan/xylan/chitin deacetylase (PgdA/CDA1 family)
MRLALKIDVDTYVGTLHGVPPLMETCQRFGADASFLFSLGPDHTGRALRRVFRPGFLAKVSRTSVLEHYGLKTLLYGVLLPGPDIGRRCAPLMRSVRDAGFEVGVHTWDHILWQDFVLHRDAAWTERLLRLAVERHTEIFGSAPRVHCAAGWQMNAHAFALLESLGFTHASDTRGRAPYRPLLDGRPSRCVELPTTLPTLDELIGRPDLAHTTPVAHLLSLTDPARQGGAPRDHVYTLHAELEGRKLLGEFGQLLAGWQAQGYRLTSLGEYHASLDLDRLPGREVAYGAIEGRSGVLAREPDPPSN